MTTSNEDDGDGPLTERERQFVVAYTSICHGNATEAAKHAGYAAASAASQGSRILARGRVKRAIHEACEGDPLIATRAELQRFWTRAVRGEPFPHVVEGVAPMQDADDPEAPARQVTMLMTPQLKDRIKASELLGKSKGLFVEKHEHELNLSACTDEQLQRIAAGDDPVAVLRGRK